MDLNSVAEHEYDAQLMGFTLEDFMIASKFLPQALVQVIYSLIQAFHFCILGLGSYVFETSSRNYQPTIHFCLSQGPSLGLHCYEKLTYPSQRIISLCLERYFYAWPFLQVAYTGYHLKSLVNPVLRSRQFVFLLLSILNIHLAVGLQEPYLPSSYMIGN